MSMLLKALALVAPRSAMWRSYALASIDAQRGYDGAIHGRRGASFGQDTGGANAQIGSSLAKLRERSSDMVRNTWIGARMLDVLVAHTVGTGIHVAWDRPVAQQLWDDWCGEASTSGDSDFAGLVALAYRSMLERGDAGMRMIPRRLQRGMSVPLQLQVLEGDFIDESRDGPIGDRNSRLGVVLGEWDERIGYWLHSSHPSDAMATSGLTQSHLTPRSEFCHLYRQIHGRAGQVRGVPLLAPVLLSARDYADLMDAMVVKSRMEACYGLLVSTETPSANIADQVRDDAQTGMRTETMRPGMIFRGRPGETVSAFTPSGSGQFEPVSLSALMGIASGGAVTYDQLTGDLRKANYSSLRAGKIEFRRLVEQEQWLTLVPLLLNRVVSTWLEFAIMSGRLRDTKKGYRRDYVMPAVEPIDPLKDLQADIKAVRAGRMSPQEFIGAWGRDWRVVVRETKEFWREADDAGLVLDIDPRRVNQTGAQQSGASDSAAAEPTTDDDE